MRDFKRKMLLLVMLLVATAAIIVVEAQYKTETIEMKLKRFIDTPNIEIRDSYVEEGIHVYKIHDIVNDKYYKLALDEDKNVDWYDVVRSNNYSKIDSSLQETMKGMNHKEKVNVIVEMVFDYATVDEHLEKNHSNYFDKEGYKGNLTAANHDKAMVVKLELMKEKVREVNVLNKKYEVVAEFEYMPFMFLSLSKSEIEELSKDSRIYSIGEVPEFIPEDLVDLNNNVTTNAIATHNNPIKASRVDLVKNAGLNGSGIKIGQIEFGAPNRANYRLINSATTNKSDCDIYERNHATEVAGIMIGSNGVAPSSSLSSACIWTKNQSASNVTNFVNGIKWLIVDRKVDIINMSAAAQKNFRYDTMDRWIDGIIYNYNVMFVKSAGNAGVNKVNTPGLAYNVITIGNLDYTGTSPVSSMDARRYSSTNNSSSYTRGLDYTVTNKPELVAPGANVNYTGVFPNGDSGTSFSTPLVSGTIALIMQNNPTIKGNYNAIKASLLASARPLNSYPKSTCTLSGWGRCYSNYHNEVGVGTLDAKAAYDLIRWGQYKNFTVQSSSSTVFTHNQTIATGQSINVAIVWSKPNTANVSSTAVNNCATDRVSDIDLEVYAPNGQKLAISRSLYNNVEWITFNTTTTGTYRFKIVNFGTYGSCGSTKGAIAWW